MASVWFAFVLVALVAGSWHAAGIVSPTIAIRTLVTAVFTCSFAVLSSLLLGMLRLGGNGLVLGLAAIVAAGVIAWSVPKGTGPSLLAWFRVLDPRSRALVGALIGFFLALVVWYTLHPVLSFDAINYHLAESLHWVKHGDPGSTYQVSIIDPYGSFPLVDEIFNGWFLAVGRGFTATSAWPAVAGGLLGIGSWTAMRTWGATALSAAVATAAILTGPLMILALNGPGNDVPAMTWMMAAVALLGMSRSHPRLIGPGLLAVGLAVGTKTTVLPYCAALVIVWLVATPRARLAGQRLFVGCLAAAGAAIGGLCYARNLVVHGSPLWPTMVAPWGDPRPVEGFYGLNATFVGNITNSLRGNLSLYRGFLSGDLALLAGAILVPVFCRRRLPVALAGVAVVGVILFAIAPSTGTPPGSSAQLTAIHIFGVRYLLPAVIPAAASMALAADAGQRWWWLGILAGACVWSLEFDITSPLVNLPSILIMLAGVACGVGIALMAPAVLRLVPAVSSARHVLAAGAALVPVVAVLTVYVFFGSRHFLDRHALASQTDSSLVGFMQRAEAAFGGRPIAMTPTMDVLTSGTNLRRDVQFIGPDESCAQIRRRLVDDTIIVTPDFGIDSLQRLGHQVGACMNGVPTVYHQSTPYGYYTVYASPGQARSGAVAIGP